LLLKEDLVGGVEKNGLIKSLTKPGQMNFEVLLQHILKNGIPLHPGLPDGILIYQKSRFGYFLEGLGIKNVSILYCCLLIFMAIWNILLPFGLFGDLVYYRFWYICFTKKNPATLPPSPARQAKTTAGHNHFST
jgi:hypothetical protein